MPNGRVVGINGALHNFIINGGWGGINKAGGLEKS